VKTRVRDIAVGATVCALALPLSACGNLLSSGSSGPEHKKRGDDVTVGLLLPERETARYEKFDHPIFEQRVKGLTHGKGKIVYANAGGNATRQRSQMEEMVAKKVDTIVLDAVDSKSIAPAVRMAKAADIPVIAYDRLAEGPVDSYVTFDGELAGQVQGQSLLLALGAKARNSKIVMVNGAPNDPNAALFKDGALGELRGHVDIARSYDVAAWKPETAEADMKRAIDELGLNNIAGVYVANDGMAGGVIKALKAAGATRFPPVTGQDTELSAVQRVVAGEQYMSLYKPYPEEAATAAEMAVRVSQGRMIEYEALGMDKSDNATTKDIRTHLIQVRPMTRKTIRSTVIEDGIYKVSEICTAAYEAACRSIGLEK
jgi:D-xylose transport system substrate-binding protein